LIGGDEVDFKKFAAHLKNEIESRKESAYQIMNSEHYTDQLKNKSENQYDVLHELADWINNYLIYGEDSLRMEGVESPDGVNIESDGNLVFEQRPRLHREILRYFKQGDYDLIEPDEYFALALYYKSNDLVELVDDSDPKQVADLIEAWGEGKIISEEELMDSIMSTGREAMAKYIMNVARHF
jgi:hypothetical protein